jgi:DNA-directed RNA polymerase subunit N (RpoN/RPB10)
VRAEKTESDMRTKTSNSSKVNKKKRKKAVAPKEPQCGKYFTHKWDSPVTGKINDELLAKKCLRCGKEFGEIYQERKNKILQRYRDKINAR